ncbi:hypothetical protein [Actinomadura flavalba]|uniref:hypothetical protein n=1 Tax=Actinomadura flavalba TaxID=1120938 RepID=UPI00037EEF61|nr:hypothetical protein [Actinomadura flavalba]
MAIKLVHTPPSVDDTRRPVPRWALRAAYALPLLLLPSCLWRLPFAFDFTMGQVGGETMPSLWISVPYVFGLSVLTETAALLCLGLVRGWGEVAPAWLPLIGGKPIRPSAAIIPATIGGLVMTAVSVMMVLTWNGVIEGTSYENGWWDALAKICVGPVGLWGPMTLALTYAYYARRCRPADTT